MIHKFRSVVVLALTLVVLIGCERPPSSADGPAKLTPAEKERLLDALAKSERESKNATAPAASITLPTLSGWSKSEKRPLPPTDHGFTIAYDHEESGLAVTLYQFTRGLTSIPNDVNSTIVKEEMAGAKMGIQQAVQFGAWQSAKEIKSEIIQLGESEQQALWSQYELTVDGELLASDIYVWAQANTIFKIRSTSHSKDAESNHAVIEPLLTALGSSGATAEE
ncbi:hypothetical protein N9Y42_01940 [Mariniblastus sp.]|nr:hypothetical protein [Mariniblastus sp.]